MMIEMNALDKPCDAAGIKIDWTLSISTGSVVGLLGGHGAGKTTVLKMIAGLLPLSPGSVFLNGIDLADQRERARQQVAAVVQGDGTLGDCLIGEQFPLPAEAEPILRELNLWRYRHHSWKALSNGLRRQMALVQVLVASRPILLLDEPLQGLGDRAARTIEAWIERRVRQPEVTAVIASCHPEFLQRLCDRVIVMQCGHRVSDATVSEMLSLSRPAEYQIKIQGILDTSWRGWFEDATVTPLHNETVISGLCLDQSALHSLLIKIRDLGLPLISVQRLDPLWEEMLEPPLNQQAG